MNNRFPYLRVTFSLAILLIAMGFIHALFFAGIPFQDPSPEQLKQYKFHNNISSFTILLGLLLFALSIILKVLQTLIGLQKRS